MGPLWEIATGVLGIVIGGLVVNWIKNGRAQAAKGRQADEHKNLVSRSDCEQCQQRHVNDILAGNDLFCLILEGQALHTQALIHLCDQDEECRELKARLQGYLTNLATRNLVKREK